MADRIAVDFDKTLTAEDGGTYFTDEPEEPDREMIEWVNQRYIDGDTIIVWTSRPWSEAAGTAARLCEWGVRHHGLLFEKGAADMYVDDKSYRPAEVLDDG